MRKFLNMLLVLLLSTPAFSQVYDVATNRSYLFDFKYSELQNEMMGRELELRHFAFADSTIAAHKIINKNVALLAKRYSHDKPFYSKLIQELESREDVEFELKHSSRQLERYNRTQTNIRTPFSIEIEPLSILSKKMTIQVTIKFSDPNERSRNENEISIYHYYMADLSSGSLQRIEKTTDPPLLNKIQKNLSARLNEMYALASNKLDFSEIKLAYDDEDSDYIDDEPVLKDSANSTVPTKSMICKDICERIDISDADFFIYGWGLMVNFQEKTASSKIFNGDGFHLFIPIHEAKSIIQLLPQLSFAATVESPTTSIRDFSLNKVYEKYDETRSPSRLKPFKYSNSAKPKSLKYTRYWIGDNGDTTIANSETIEYNAQGEPLAILSGSRNEYFEYSGSGKITLNTYSRSKPNDSYDDDDRSDAYLYTTEGNLKRKTNIQYRSMTLDEYFYNGNNVYHFNHGPLNEISNNSSIHRYTYTGTVLQSEPSTITHFDNAGVFKATLPNYGRGATLTSRNAQGMLSEVKTGDGTTYFDYDQLGRLISYKSSSEGKINHQISYEYDGQEPLPSREIEIKNPNVGSRYVLKYNWEYFK